MHKQQGLGLSARSGSLLISLGFLSVAMCQAWAATPSVNEGLTVSWMATQPNTIIKVFGPDEIKALKKTSSSEAEPGTGKKEHFEGILLSDIVDKALNGMANERKAQVDLVILKNSHGAEALIPRSFIVKYPVVLANSKDHKALPGLRSIVPWTSRSKTRSEGLPLETYFVDDVNEVQLANYRERYGNVYLKRRMDPTALRGEKIFVQSCLSCHDSEQGMERARHWGGQHPTVNGSPKLDSREQRALQSYLEMFKSEQGSPTAFR